MSLKHPQTTISLSDNNIFFIARFVFSGSHGRLYEVDQGMSVAFGQHLCWAQVESLLNAGVRVLLYQGQFDWRLVDIPLGWLLRAEPFQAGDV